MSKRQTFVIRLASPRDESAVLALVPRLRALGVYEKAAYRADFVRYVKQLR